MAARMRFQGRFLLAACVIGLLGLVSGCGEQARSPLGSDATPAVAGAVDLSQAGVFVFTRDALTPRAAKVAGTLATETTAGEFGIPGNGGVLGVQFGAYGDSSTVRVSQTSFTVYANSISPPPGYSEPTLTITMAVNSGSTLGDVLVAFQPSGTRFTPNATLVVSMVGPAGLKAGDYTVYHVYHDGHVELITATVTVDGANTTFTVPVPGFSEYSWNDAPEASTDP